MNFESLLSKFESLGYRVERVTEDSAVIHNHAENEDDWDDYTEFDNTVATLAVNHGFGFYCQENMKEMHMKTVRERKPPENYDIYMGVYRGDDGTILNKSNLSFKDI